MNFIESHFFFARPTFASLLMLIELYALYFDIALLAGHPPGTEYLKLETSLKRQALTLTTPTPNT